MKRAGAAAGDVLLAFDTSVGVGSVALARAGEVIGRAVLGRRAEHAARLVPAIAGLLEECEVERAHLGGIVVGEGPGSFTGVRIAAATAKGLGRALSIPVLAVSSLAGAALASMEDPIRYALFDARGERVYGACYGVGRAGVQTLVAPHAGTLREVLGSEVPPGAVFVGDAAARHASAIEGAGHCVARANRAESVAEGLLRFAALRPELAPVDPSVWEPRYLRASSAVPS